MERTWPLAGRDAELRAIGSALRPGSAGILLAGPAGVGKTRLAREALSAAARRGARVLWAHGSTAARPFPLGAFAGVVDDVPTGDATQVVPAMINVLIRPGRLVLGVDDAHLLDELSAVLVHRLVLRRLAAVVLTIRDGEPAPDAVTKLTRDDHLSRLDLAPLSRETVAQLVAQVLGGQVESAAVRRFWALTQGSPLLLRHLLESEVSSGRLSPGSSGLWCWWDAPEISPALTTIVRDQIGDLTPGVRDVIDLLALAEPLDPADLADLATEAADVEEAEARGLVRTDEASGRLQARLAHPMYGEVRRAVMGRVRARRLRGLVAAKLNPERSLLPRAVLALGSDLPPDPGLFLRAAKAAISLYDLPLAERLAGAAVAAGGGIEARLTHASALSWLSRGDEAEDTLAALSTELPAGPLRVMATAYRVGNLFWTLRQPEKAEALLHEALADPASGPAKVYLEAMQVALDASTGNALRALDHGTRLLRAELSDRTAVLLVASAVAAGASVTGRRDTLTVAARAGEQAARGSPTGVPRFGLADWLILGHRLAGETAEAERVAAELRVVSEDLPGPARFMGQVLAGHAALTAGKLPEALRLLREAWAGLEPSPHEFRFRCRTLLAVAYALCGDLAAARPHLADLEREQHPAYVLYRPDDLLARAWVHAAEGAISAAVTAAHDAADLARVQESPAYEVLAWQTAVQLGDPVDAVERLAHLGAMVDGPRAAVALAHASALSAQDGDALDATSRRWEALGDLIAAGDAAAQAAEVHRRGGRHGSAVAAATRAHVLGERCDARTPALTQAAVPLPLTVREREIAALAAHGLSNREIADRLTVSVRTVEGHLYRAGHKLGISDRGSFAAFLDVSNRSD